MRHHFQRRSEDHNQCSLINIYIGIYILFFHKTSSALTLTLLSFAMSQVTNRGYLGSKGANKGFLSEEHVFISQSLTDISEGVPFTDSLGEKKKKCLYWSLKNQTSMVYSHQGLTNSTELFKKYDFHRSSPGTGRFISVPLSGSKEK